MVPRATFSYSQLTAYFERVHLPAAQRVYDVAALSAGEQLDYLATLTKHHLVSVPWENLTQHYSYARSVQTHAHALFRKIVAEPTPNNRGGYCMETNHALHVVLHSLGFRAHMAGARICSRESGEFGGWTHIVNIVRIGDGGEQQQRYLVDGGYGGGAPAAPVALVDGADADMGIGTPGARVRVVRRGLAQNADSEQRMWMYEYRFAKRGEEEEESVHKEAEVNQSGQQEHEGDGTGAHAGGWTTAYCFTDLEFLPEDVAGINYAPWLNPRTFFTFRVVAVRFTTAAEPEPYPGAPDEAALAAPVDGSIVLNHSQLTWRRRGRKVADIVLTTEAERVLALQQYFGIVLSADEADAIVGTSAMLGVPVNAM